MDELQSQFPERLIVKHCLSRPHSEWFNRSNDLEFRKGRVDEEAINWFINTYPPYAQDVQYYICGPGKMIENTKSFLQKIDVPLERIFIESLGGDNSQAVLKYSRTLT